MSQLKPAWDRGIPCPLDKPHCGPGAGLSQPTATLENLQPNIFSHLAQAPEGLFLCLKMKKKKKKVLTYQTVFQKLVSKLLNPESFEGNFFVCLFSLFIVRYFKII